MYFHISPAAKCLHNLRTAKWELKSHLEKQPGQMEGDKRERGGSRQGARDSNGMAKSKANIAAAAALGGCNCFKNWWHISTDQSGRERGRRRGWRVVLRSRWQTELARYNYVLNYELKCWKVFIVFMRFQNFQLSANIFGQHLLLIPTAQESTL